jgi:predicted dehydrogenase
MAGRLRCCAIGATGKWFRSVHRPSLARLVEAGRVEMAAACSRSEEGRAALTAEYGYARAYADVDEMLDAEKPDYVVLSMASRPMSEMALRLFERKIPLLMEKPAGHNVEAGRRLAGAAAASGVPHLVAYNRRFNPLLNRVKELVSERGGLSQVSCEFLRHDVVAPRRLMGSSLHSIDALRYLAGEVREFGGAGSAARYFDGKMVAASFHLTFESGVAGSFTFNVRAGRSYERYRLFAENWTATVSLPSPGKYDDRWWLRVEDGDREVEKLTTEDLPPEERNGPCAHGFWREHEYFVDCLRRGERPRPDVADGVRSMELSQALLESVAPEQAEKG